MSLVQKENAFGRLILKRHRDNWSKDNPDLKPISIILTTLAARAYNGETDIVAALAMFLKRWAVW